MSELTIYTKATRPSITFHYSSCQVQKLFDIYIIIYTSIYIKYNGSMEGIYIKHTCTYIPIIIVNV